jgi:hypothetical protein
MSKGRYANALERARGSAEDCLSRFRPEQRGTILLGALASVYGVDEGGSRGNDRVDGRAAGGSIGRKRPFSYLSSPDSFASSIRK